MPQPARPPTNEGTASARALREGEELEAFRLVKVRDCLDPAFVESFKSNAELGKPPRGRELREAEVHRGVSVYKALDQAVDLRDRIVRGLIRAGKPAVPGIGDYVAMVRLVGPEFCVEDRSAPNGHMTVWAPASRLAACAVDVVPAARET